MGGDNLFSGPGYLLRGFGLIMLPGLRRYVMVPLLVNLLLFGALVWWGVVQIETLSGWINGWLPSWLGWLTWLLWPLFFLSVVLVLFYTFSLLANLIAAPFNGILSEKVERHLNGQPLAGGDWKTLLKDAAKSFLVALRKLSKRLLIALPLLLLFVIPVVNLAAPFVWFAYSAWMLAASYLDYPLDNHLVPYREQRDQTRALKLTTLGFGALTLGATMIPVVNFLVMPAAVAGATALWMERFPRGR